MSDIEYDTEVEATLTLGEVLEDLKESDPSVFNVLDDILNDYDNFLKNKEKLKVAKARAMKAYLSSEKGKQANRRAARRYYQNHKDKILEKQRERQKNEREKNKNIVNV